MADLISLVHDGKKPETSPRRCPYRQLPHTADLAWRLSGERSSGSSLKIAGRALSATLTEAGVLSNAGLSGKCV